MQVQSIISKTISEEILQKGHLSIRFKTDGFSLLLEDQSFRPVILNNFSDETQLSLQTYVRECENWLQRHTLIPEFLGEVSILSDNAASTLVPDDLFSESSVYDYLKPLTPLSIDQTLGVVPVQDRKAKIIFETPGILNDLAGKFKGNSRIIPVTLAMLSLADQVHASDHQRGFALLEMQRNFLAILVIKNDRIVLCNHMNLKSTDELFYHILNTLQQVEFDREHAPVYYTGHSYDTVLKSLKKYIRRMAPLSYHILDIQKKFVADHVLLVESSHCE
ncbi:MAG: DUF3822 family protein [Bacteroidales bacterium]|nr:DUF3822 family protein [Bacteroidales bacterium]